jgi:ubiquinone/menaquinone biosynthesis C-methylase UbiE
MNRIHRWLCNSAAWKRTLEQRIPWVLDGVDLGQNVLEVGPGGGLTTNILKAYAPRITVLEIDQELADQLQARTQSTVRVVRGDATSIPFLSAQFSGVVSCTMLHHLPSEELQDQLLREVRRVLQPGGVFVGMDSLTSFSMRLIHIRDTLVPVNPATFRSRLQGAGFDQTSLEISATCFRFCGRVPHEQTRGTGRQ